MKLANVEITKLTPDVIAAIKAKVIRLDSHDEEKDFFLELYEHDIMSFKDIEGTIEDVEDILKYCF